MKRMLCVLLVLALSACAPVPAPLSPDAQAAFHATRVVKVLDVVRDAAIAANETLPPVISTASTREVVLWHKTAVQTIQAVPNGWRDTVRAGLYRLTCDVRAGTGPCEPRLSPTEVQRLTPYVGLALVIMDEVK